MASNSYRADYANDFELHRDLQARYPMRCKKWQSDSRRRGPALLPPPLHEYRLGAKTLPRYLLGSRAGL